MYTMITTMDPIHGGIPLTNDAITNAKPFEGWGPEYLKWPDRLWIKPGHRPDENIEHNAYHTHVLANSMKDTKAWVGNTLVIYPCMKHIRDGNHRYRAAQYLWDVFGIPVDLGEIIVTDKPCWWCKNV